MIATGRRAALVALALAASACSLVRDLDYLGDGKDQLPDLCKEGGWCVLPNTKLSTVCPDNNAEHEDLKSTCNDVTENRNSAVYDQARQRLVVWGGGSGQVGHFGNEVFALSLLDKNVKRLTNASPTPQCASALPDGTPYPRSTFDSLAAVVHADRLLAVGGDTLCGQFDDMWAFDLGGAKWKNLAPAGPDGCDPAMAGSCSPGAVVGTMSDYDPVSRFVYVKDPYRFWRYSYDENRYELLREDVSSSYTQTGRIDPDRRLFVYAGCASAETCVPTLHAISIDPATLYSDSEWDISAGGCEALAGADGPGFEYDAARKVFVGWPNAGGTVYLLDPDTKSCAPAPYEGGPPPAEIERGTYGRFRYMPGFDAFVVINDIENDAYVLRL